MRARIRGKCITDIRVGKAVRALRNTEDVTRKELAAFVGVSSQQIEKYETAKNRISASVLYEIAKYFDVPVGYFFSTCK